MSKTEKDLKSHKTGYGRYGRKPKRRLKPLAWTASIESGESTNLVPTYNNDIKQEDFNELHHHNAKNVRAIRKQFRMERQDEKGSARQRLKANDKRTFDEL